MKKYFGMGVNELDTYLDYTLFSVLILYVFHASPSHVGWMGACFAIPFFFSSHLFGIIVDGGNIFLWRAIFFTINIIAMPFVSMGHHEIILYIVILIKMTARCGISISNAKLNDNDEGSRDFYKIYGYLVNMSRIVMPLVVIFFFNYYGILFVIFLSMLLNALGVYCSVKGEGHCHKNNLTANKKNAHGYSFWIIFRENHQVALLITTYTVVSLAFFLSSDMLTVFFSVIGEDKSSMGLIVSLLGCGGTIGTKWVSELIKNIEIEQVFFISVFIYLLSFSCFAFLSVVDTPVLIFYVAIICVGMASAMTFFAIRYGVRHIFGFEHVGKAMGTVQMLSAIIAILMPILGGYISGYFSITITFRITVLILGAILTYALLSLRWRNKGEDKYV